jgi:hypothetical protein
LAFGPKKSSVGSTPAAARLTTNEYFFAQYLLLSRRITNNLSTKVKQQRNLLLGAMRTCAKMRQKCQNATSEGSAGRNYGLLCEQIEQDETQVPRFELMLGILGFARLEDYRERVGFLAHGRAAGRAASHATRTPARWRVGLKNRSSSMRVNSGDTANPQAVESQKLQTTKVRKEAAGCVGDGQSGGKKSVSTLQGWSRRGCRG